jgi:hypothetical protein
MGSLGLQTLHQPTKQALHQTAIGLALMGSNPTDNHVACCLAAACILLSCCGCCCSRCRVLLHVLDGTSPDPVGDYKAIQLELELFNPALLDKPQARGCCCCCCRKLHRASSLSVACYGQ